MNRDFQSRQSEKKYSEQRSDYDRLEPLKADQIKIKQIVVEGNVDVLIDYADKVGKNLYDLKLTMNQIRNVFGTVRQIQMKWDSNPAQSYREAVLLIPKLGYYAEREKTSKGSKSRGMETFQNIFSPALKFLTETGLTDNQKRDRLFHIADFMEAVVAYHKKHGGK